MIGPFRKQTMVQAAPGCVYAPVAGQVKQLSEVSDAMFADGLLGPGVAIEPTGRVVRAPIAGEVIVMPASHHAIGIRSPEGLEVLVHIGINTVNLNGLHFKAHVGKGDQVQLGQRLIDFDRRAIEGSGYDVITPIVITNSEEYGQVVIISRQVVSDMEQILEVQRQ